jgi:hypothetical protein
LRCSTIAAKSQEFPSEKEFENAQRYSLARRLLCVLRRAGLLLRARRA